MALRIRSDGRVFCAALHKELPDDTYIDDGLHYRLSVELKVLVTDSNHKEHGEWWWINQVPDNIVVDKWWE